MSNEVEANDVFLIRQSDGCFTPIYVLGFPPGARGYIAVILIAKQMLPADFLAYDHCLARLDTVIEPNNVLSVLPVAIDDYLKKQIWPKVGRLIKLRLDTTLRNYIDGSESLVLNIYGSAIPEALIEAYRGLKDWDEIVVNGSEKLSSLLFDKNQIVVGKTYPSLGVFASPAYSSESMPQTHSVKIALNLNSGEFGTSNCRDHIRQFEQAVMLKLEAAAAGHFDGNEYGDGVCLIWMYGDDADLILDIIRDDLLVLMGKPFVSGGYVLKRYGDISKGAEEIKIDF